MIHEHNDAEHQALQSTVDNLQGVLDALWVEYGNGHSNENPRLAKQLAIANKWSKKLAVQLENHASNTKPYDGIVRNYKTIITIGKWCLGVLAGVLVIFLSKYLM